MHTDDNKTRRQAIADGELVDVTEQAKEAGFKIPVAFMADAWQELVVVPAQVLEVDTATQLRDVLETIQLASNFYDGEFSINRFSPLRDVSEALGPTFVSFHMYCGPDDEGMPCLTAWLLDEEMPHSHRRGRRTSKPNRRRRAKR